jgi:hypothetical protein
LNVLVDENPDGFGHSIVSYLHKVDDPSQVGIFIAFLHGPNANGNYICHALIEMIYQFGDPTNLTRNIPTFMTQHISLSTY